MAQHEELDVLGGGRATRQQDQPEHQPEDQIEQTQRHVEIMSDQQSLLVSDPRPTSGTPHGAANGCNDRGLGAASVPAEVVEEVGDDVQVALLPYQVVHVLAYR